MTRDQMAACIALEAEGLYSVTMPLGLDSPIPGAVLLADMGHQKLLRVEPDGTVVDLFEVHRLAEDCIRNWQKEKTLPGFVGDFKRLTPLAKALNGRKPTPEVTSQ